MINQLLSRPKGVLRVFPGSITQLTEDELNRIDAWQDANRGFKDDDKSLPDENSYEGSWTE